MITPSMRKKKKRKQRPHYPRKLQRMASELAMQATYMFGYVCHAGQVAKDHPSMIKLNKANADFQNALVEWEQKHNLW